MKNISALQVVLVGVIGMVLRHYRILLPEDELTAFVIGATALTGIVWAWIERYRKGELSLGGFKRN